MRYQGKITTWKDDKGFGFITQNGDGKQIFVHIKSFANRTRRPVGNETITYEVTTDEQGRLRAKNVIYTDELREATYSVQEKLGIATVVATVFFTLLIVLAVAGRLPIVVSAFYLVMSLMTYFVYKADKAAAQNGDWRTSESTLHLLSLIGGWCGALIAQQRLRHKSKKAEFQFVFWITVTLNCGFLLYLLTSFGLEMLNAFLPIALRTK